MSNGITINSVMLQKESITASKYDNLFAESWEKDVLTFLKDWFSKSKTITVTTSGSTGTPKQLSIPKTYMENSAKMTCDFFNLTEGNRALLCLSANYIAGKMMLVRAIVRQLDLILVPPSNTPLESLTSAVHFAAMVPTQVMGSIQQLDRIQTLIIGGAPVSNSLQEQLQNCQTACWSTYGMTETVSHVALKKLNGQDQSGHYLALPEVEFSCSEEQCLIIHAPKLSAQVIHTTDVVKLNSHNSFTWIGRKDNVINSGGIKIHPELIEEKLKQLIQLPYIITSFPHEKWGNQVVLLIESNSMTSAQKTVLLKKTADVLEKYEQPKEVFTLTKFAMTETGKIKRKATQQKLISNSI